MASAGSIFAVDLTGSGPPTLLAKLGGSALPAFSNDLRRAVWADSSGAYLSSLDGSAPRKLVAGSYPPVSLSGGGRWVAAQDPASAAWTVWPTDGSAPGFVLARAQSILSFDPTDQFVAGSSAGHGLTVWSLADPTHPHPLLDDPQSFTHAEWVEGPLAQ